MVTTQEESSRVVIRDMLDGAYVGDMRKVAGGVYVTALGEADLLGKANLVHESSLTHEIRSAEDRCCVRLPESMANGARRSALLVLSKTLGLSHLVRCDSEKGSATIGQMIALPESMFGKLPELIVDAPGSKILLTMNGPIITTYLSKADIPSSSSHLDPAQAKRINVGSKPSRERLVSDLPTINELDRGESQGGCGDTAWKRSQGTYTQEMREHRHASSDY